jgi:alkylation response protein AidB-like acyl-CoA dehydrogenase
MGMTEALESICTQTVAPAAVQTDADAQFPREAMKRLGQEGLLGLVCAKEVGGMGSGLREAVAVISRLAQDCPSTAMVLCMHYIASHVIEGSSHDATRRAIAAGQHITTLAFSETGSRSHFWAPMGTARASGDKVLLDADKSWITSAVEADSYVWSSKPLAADGASTLWLVDSKLAGLRQPAKFNGLGLRGNASSPMVAKEVSIDLRSQIGENGKGFDTMMGVVLPWFSVLNAAGSVGLCEGILGRAIAHVQHTQHQHLGTGLADLPTIRAYLAKARIKTDMAHALLQDTVSAIETSRPDTMLRVLEVKAACAETALEVSDLAMRVCGGAAFRREAGMERLFRDARAANAMAPTSDVLYDFIGKAITGLPLF